MLKSLRIDKDGDRPRSPVHFSFDGEIILSFAGETIGAALWAAGRRVLRTSPTAGTPRSMFCAMGSCQECVVNVKGMARTACNTPIEPGLDVRSMTPLTRLGA